MARKDPYRTVRIREAILDLLRPLLEGENKAQFRPLSLNAFCEKILFDYATGKYFEDVNKGSRSLRGGKGPLAASEKARELYEESQRDRLNEQNKPPRRQQG